MAIRQNTTAAWNNGRTKALYTMKQRVLAVLWHCTDPEADLGLLQHTRWSSL